MESRRQHLVDSQTVKGYLRMTYGGNWDWYMSRKGPSHPGFWSNEVGDSMTDLDLKTGQAQIHLSSGIEDVITIPDEYLQGVRALTELRAARAAAERGEKPKGD
tara:strand:+ start:2029 stop:2340 length:312 start_codon:yes stop_codon:yes gene_type:complete